MCLHFLRAIFLRTSRPIIFLRTLRAFICLCALFALIFFHAFRAFPFLKFPIFDVP